MSTVAPLQDADEFWLFGYGSLIWKPPPHFGSYSQSQVENDRHLTGIETTQIDGSRALSRAMFAVSGSQDHRGTPEAPGRVVTLIEKSYWNQLKDHHDSAPERVWGVAYRIVPERVAEVKDYLDIREINGYTIHYTPFHPAAGVDPATLPTQVPISTLVYIGTPENDQFVGPEDPRRVVDVIFHSHGPSGPNPDYLFGLEKALDELSAESGDEHVTDLSNRLREMMAARRVPTPGPHPAPGPPQEHHFRRASSVDEQEETEKTS